MEHHKPVPTEIEAALAVILARPPAEAAPIIANVAHRAAATLHGLANREAKGRKGTPGWAKWARLVNAARMAVLQTNACREAARGLEESR